MYILLKVIAAGIIGTIIMDTVNFLISKTGIITKIDIKMIGRMSVGWLQGRFIYKHPNEIKPINHEFFFGYLAHYAIGVAIAVLFVFGWDILIGGNISPFWIFVYGIITTLGSYLIIYPSMGLGIFGFKSTEGLKNTISSFINHLFFGVGMAIGIVLT